MRIFNRFLTYTSVLLLLVACGAPKPVIASTRAQSIQFLLSQVRTSSGGALVGGKVYFYSAGTDTPKTVWIDSLKATAAANPYTLDSNGTAQLYGDGNYRVVIKDASGVTRYDRDNLYFTLGTEIVSDSYGTLAEADAAAAAAGKSLLISTVWNTVPGTLNSSVTFVKGGGLNNSGTVTFTVPPTITGDFQVFFGTGLIYGLREVEPDYWGAHGDNSTAAATNDAAFAAMMASAVPRYNYSTIAGRSYDDANVIGNYPLIILKGAYKMTFWDISYRNDLNIEFRSASLSYQGANGAPGVPVVEAKGSSRMRTKDVLIFGNGKAGTFWHQSGDGYVNGDSTTHDSCSGGKGNVYSNVHENMRFWNQYDVSLPMFDATPYSFDTLNTWYYSMDDSEFNFPYFSSTGTLGFGFSFGSSEIHMNHPIINTPNGIAIQSGVTLRLNNPVFSLSSDSYGAIYVLQNAWFAGTGGGGHIELIAPYLEGTTKPLFSFDPAITSGRQQSLKIVGGLLSQKTGATRLINIPAAITGNIEIDGTHVQNPYGRKIYAPGCNLRLVSPTSGSSSDDYGIDVESVASADIKKSGVYGFIEGQSGDTSIVLDVGASDAQSQGHYMTIDDALDACNKTKQHVTIYLTTNQTISRAHRISGDVQITTSNGSTLTLNTAMTVTGVFAIDTVPVANGINHAIINSGGQVFLNTLTATAGLGMNMILHQKGTTQFSSITILGGGTVVDGTYAYGTGVVAHKGNTVTSGVEVTYAAGTMIIDKT